MIMERTDLIDLGVASVETKGGKELPIDVQNGQNPFNLIED